MQDVIDILLVDDEARNLDALEAILEDPGYRLLRAENADAALHALLANDVAAVVLDIRMPGMSGFELAQLIKGTKKFRQIPIVLLTAHLLDDRDVISGYDAGAVDYLTKPVNPSILRHKVSVFADLFRKTRALAELNETLETRVQERTAELAKSEAALRQADEKKDVFLATLAHELRTPLAPLRTGIDVLSSRLSDVDGMGTTLSSMNRQIDYMVRLIDDLLNVSRISHGTLEMRKEPTELASAVEQAMALALPAYTQRGQSIVFDAERVTALVDATRIAQVVANLLNNASKHSPSGSKVCIRLRRAADQGVIDVADEGVGIPADQLSSVFEMFTRVVRPGEAANTGLGIGLGLSRRLAELHGGTLTAVSGGDRNGSTFTLSVPIGAVDAVAAPTPRTPVKESTPPPASRTPLNVVVVEDNEDSAEMIALWLENLGHHVKVAQTGPEGVALILETRPNLVLCDIGLPEMDGVEVCRRVLDGTSVPPVMVALTGWGGESERNRTVNAGFRNHLVKPVELVKLRAVVDSVEREISARSTTKTLSAERRTA